MAGGSQKTKGKGTGKMGAKRKSNQEKKGVDNITKGDIRRLARRGGVKRISSGIYTTTRETLEAFLH